MDRCKHAQTPVKDVPQDIMDRGCNLAPLSHRGHALVKMRKGTHGLPQAGVLANECLKKHLAKQGFHPKARTPGLFTHETRPITFALIVDDFGVKRVGQERAEHLGSALRDSHKATEDWEGKLCLGITLKWDSKQEQSTSPCQATSKKRSPNSATRHPTVPNTLHMHGQHLPGTHVV